MLVGRMRGADELSDDEVAAELGVDLADVTGTGPAGRSVKPTSGAPSRPAKLPEPGKPSRSGKPPWPRKLPPRDQEQSGHCLCGRP